MRLVPQAAGRASTGIDRRPRGARAGGAGARRDWSLRRQCLRFEFQEDTGAEHHASAEHEGHLRAPMPGHVLDVRAAAGAAGRRGRRARGARGHEDGALARGALGRNGDSRCHVKPGDRVEEGVELVLLEPIEGPHCGIPQHRNESRFARLRRRLESPRRTDSGRREPDERGRRIDVARRGRARGSSDQRVAWRPAHPAGRVVRACARASS